MKLAQDSLVTLLMADDFLPEAEILEAFLENPWRGFLSLLVMEVYCKGRFDFPTPSKMGFTDVNESKKGFICIKPLF